MSKALWFLAIFYFLVLFLGVFIAFSFLIKKDFGNAIIIGILWPMFVYGLIGTSVLEEIKIEKNKKFFREALEEIVEKLNKNGGNVNEL